MEKETNKTLYILCGEAYTGKSTLAKKIADRYDAKIIGRDDLYFAIEQPLALEETLYEEDEVLWNNLWPIVIQGVKNWLTLGKSVVFDDNCLRLSQRDELKAIAKECEAHSVLIYLDLPEEVLKERKEKNKLTNERHDVPSGLLANDRKKFERPSEEEGPIIYTPDTSFDDLLKKLDG